MTIFSGFHYITVPVPALGGLDGLGGRKGALGLEGVSGLLGLGGKGGTGLGLEGESASDMEE